ncbi:STM4014 family protein [Actinospica robiniae]|uniref:STM4014 family protein n=1 Tax=Actinospica robiniae TaxID=304901 RepID=UPI0005516D4A|nr:STM4014 family protein [Actinospica robiniae]
MSPLRLAVVGNPDNRRVGLFNEAAASLGMAAPRVVPWLDVLGGSAAFHQGELVRIDSPGEDAEVTRLLRGESRPIDMYRVEGTRAWYEGFVKALEALHASIEADGAQALASADETAIAFDKSRCHALLSERGISVPEAVSGVVDFESLVASRRETGWDEAYVKIRHGSSASGVVKVRTWQGELRAETSAELHRAPSGYELYNSLKFRTYQRRSEIKLVIDRLAEDGLHVEHGIGKISIQGQATDLRLVTVGGRVTHAVGRSSDLPITNLHLGGKRREAAEYREVIGEERWAQVIETAERTAACFPQSHCLGIDILSDQERDYVAEVNAYGDLLPRLLGLPGTLGEAVDTYTAQLKSLQAQYG